MDRRCRRRLGTLETLATAALRRRSVRVEGSIPGLPPGGATASVLAFAPDAGRWLVAVLVHELQSLRVLDVSRLSSAAVAPSPARACPATFDPLAFACGGYLGWGITPHRTFSIRPGPRLARWLPALLPTTRPGSDRSGRPLLRLQAAWEQAVFAATSSLGAAAAVDSDPPMPPRQARDDTGAVRCLRLAQWLLTQDEPASRERIYAAFPDDYAGSAAAKEKKFGRDKLLLRKLGFALETVGLGAKDEAVGYLLDSRSSALPQVEFTPDEAALIWAAGAAALRLSDHPLRDELENGLRKLVVGGKGLPPRAAAVEELEPQEAPTGQRALLEKLIDAWERRKTITVDYWRASSGEVVTRQVDVHGWALRRGEWIFVGHCHLRGGTRIFYLSRCRKLKMNAVRAQDADYAIPEGFDVRRWSRQQPWDYQVHPPVEAVVRLRGSLARIARSILPAARLATEADGARTARLPVRNLRGLVRQVLAWGAEAELLEPAEGRAMALEILERVVASAGEVAP